jgi:hypothetical protein
MTNSLSASGRGQGFAADHTRPADTSNQTEVQEFKASIAELLELWIGRCRSPHTQRAYMQDVMGLIQFLEIPWPLNRFDY